MRRFATLQRIMLACSPLLLCWAGNGGGVAISVTSDPQPRRTCPGLPYWPGGNVTYWPYSHSTQVTISNCTIANNVASSPTSSGGGVHLAEGGLLALRGSVLRGNTAGLFGGGLCLGSGQSSDTCALQLLEGTAVMDNAAGHGSAQVYMGCTADMLVQQSSIGLTSRSTQVCLGWHRQPVPSSSKFEAGKQSSCKLQSWMHHASAWNSK